MFVMLTRHLINQSENRFILCQPIRDKYLPDELEELSESELSEPELLDSILFTLFFTTTSVSLFLLLSEDGFDGAELLEAVCLPGAFFT